MDTREYSELCRDLSLLNVENIEALSETDAFVEGEKVGVVFGEGSFDGVHTPTREGESVTQRVRDAPASLTWADGPSAALTKSSVGRKLGACE